MDKSDRYTLAYRAAETSQVMAWVEAGQSGCLIGLRGAGKSNFLRFLLRQDVQQHYLGQAYADYVFVLIDLLALTECTEWAVYEMVLDRLLHQMRLLREEEAIEGLESLHREVVHSRDLLTAQRAVERCMDIFCQRLTRRVVLLFDEFGTVFRACDPSLLRGLRAIRDAHKGQVSYVVVVTGDLAHLRDDLSEVNHFYRLVSRNVCGLGPYSEADARQMIGYLASQRSIELSAGDTAHLIELSGGHAGLLKAILSMLWGVHYGSSLSEIVPSLGGEPTIEAECRKVWGSLGATEQIGLRALAGGMQADPHTLHRLERKGLVEETRSKACLFSRVFGDFVRQQALPVAEGTQISRSPRRVQIDGRRVENLTELEFEILCYLYEHQGQVCSKDELIANIYRQRYNRMAGGVTDEALQTLISRLRAKIESDRQRPRYVITVHGEGYKFVDSDDS